MSFRLRLTLLYSGLLAAALVLFSLLLYGVLQWTFVRAVDNTLADVADRAAHYYQQTGRLPQLESLGDRSTFVMIRVEDAPLVSSGNFTGLFPLPEAARNGQPVFSSEAASSGEHYRLLTWPVPVRNSYLYVQVAQTLFLLDATESQLIFPVGVGMTLFLGLGALGAWFLAGRALRPINSVATAARAIGESADLSLRVPYQGPEDELGVLVRTFNDMLAQLNALYGRLAASVDAQQRFVADASHELRTPLTIIRGNIDYLQRAGQLDREALADMSSEAERMTRLIEELLTMARADAGQAPDVQPVALGPLVADVCRTAQALPHEMEFRQELPEALSRVMVLGNSEWLSRALLILIDNAFKYTPSGSVTVRAGRQGEGVVVQVQDTGIGIAREDVPHIFERFYRADRARGRGGAGLGLAIARWVAGAHGGKLTADSEPGKGSTFNLWLPLYRGRLPRKILRLFSDTFQPEFSVLLHAEAMSFAKQFLRREPTMPYDDEREHLGGQEHIEPSADTSRQAAPTPAPARAQEPAPAQEPADPMMELPEIPAAGQAEPAFPAQAAEAPTRKSASGWKLFAAGLALVAVGAGVGSVTTLGLSSRIQRSMLPIGYTGAISTPRTVAAQSTPEGGTSVIPGIYQRVSPSVVAINVVAQRGQRQGQATGTGFVVDGRGYIMTNAHVVDGATEIQVKFVDGTVLDAKLVGADKYQDMAVIKVDPGNRGMIAAALGDSDKVQVGELAVAIGTPFEQEFTVTAGIVSALNREVQEGASAFKIKGAIQTDAAINPGNSGGPLINDSGEVIGINTLIDTGNTGINGNIGIGFALPINAAKAILPKLISGEKVQYAWMGVGLGELTPDVAQQIGTDAKEGAVIGDVYPNSPAEAAGIKGMAVNRRQQPVAADVVTAIDGQPVKTASDLVNIVGGRKIGDKLALTVARGKERLTLTVTLAARPDNLDQLQPQQQPIQP